MRFEDNFVYPDKTTIVKEDLVNQPPHYTKGKVECIDAIESALTPEEFRGYCKGVVLAYVWREQYKGKDEDIKKSIWYLRRLEKREKSGSSNDK